MWRWPLHLRFARVVVVRRPKVSLKRFRTGRRPKPQVAVTLVGAAVGAVETARLRPIGYSALGLGVVISVFFMMVYLAAGQLVAGWFVDDVAVVALAAQLLVVAALFQVADGAQVIGAALLRGLTDVKLPAVITFVAYWLVAIPGGYVFGVRGTFGAVGIWTALAVGLGLAAVFLAWRFARLTRVRHS